MTANTAPTVPNAIMLNSRKSEPKITAINQVSRGRHYKP